MRGPSAYKDVKRKSKIFEDGDVAVLKETSQTIEIRWCRFNVTHMEWYVLTIVDGKEAYYWFSELSKA